MRPAGRAPQRARGVRQRAGAVGNPLVAAPQYSATNAITVDATPVAVWPWLVQMAAYGGRLVCVRPPRQRRRDERMGDRPELQGLKVGYVMATDRSGEGFLVEAIDPARSLVLCIRSTEAVTSAALVLEPTVDGRTRLVLRLRLRAGRTLRGLGYRALMEVGHVIMTRRMLFGIKARVESLVAREAHALEREELPVPQAGRVRG